MIRYTLFVLTILGTAAAAVTTVTPANSFVMSASKNISVFYKNQAFPLIVQKCAVEDCSDTPSSNS